MKKLLLLIPIIILSCSGSSDDDSDCRQTWQYKEYCKKTYNCGWCEPESEASIKERPFKCSELDGIKEGSEIHLSERDSDCFKFYRKYIKRID